MLPILDQLFLCHVPLLPVHSVKKLGSTHFLIIFKPEKCLLLGKKLGTISHVTNSGSTISLSCAITTSLQCEKIRKRLFIKVTAKICL